MVDVNAKAWTTLALVREHLEFKAADTSKDEQLKSLINRSLSILERHVGRVMKATDYTEHYDGDATNTLILKQWPIISVTSIHDDTARDFNADSEISSDDYLIYDDIGIIKLYNDETIFVQGLQNVKIVYRAGYETIPDDLEFASTLHVATFYKKANKEGFLSMSLGGMTLAFERSPIPREIKTILEPFRKRSV